MVSSKKAEQIYRKIKNNLKGQEGKIVAIEVDSGDYFVGKDTTEACEKAHEKHPNKKFYFKRVGAKYTYFVGNHENSLLARTAACFSTSKFKRN